MFQGPLVLLGSILPLQGPLAIHQAILNLELFFGADARKGHLWLVSAFFGCLELISWGPKAKGVRVLLTGGGWP